MSEIKLSAGTIEYTDTGGDGPAIVLLHGLLMDASLWDGPVAELSAAYRCVVPTLPLGAHRRPMHADADLSLPGIARLVAEFLDRLGLRDVTLIGNDTGGALAQLLIGAEVGASDGAARIGRVMLISCDAVTARWMRPVLEQSGIRRDTVRMLRTIGTDPRLLLRAAEALPGFGRPALVVWAAQDRVMPPEHGRRLAGLFPQGQLIEVADSYTLIPLDQPATLARAIEGFVPLSVSLQ